jgi:hypothetical protein
MGDFITPLGWLSEENNKLAADRLLRKAEPDAPNGRTSIYVCPECADLGCGAVTAIIERVGDTIVWRNLGVQNNYDETIWRDDFEDIGPFAFNATDYSETIRTAMEK